MGHRTSRKDQILGVAERLFRHYGPAKTTVADIARECGIGVGSVYLDFSSKEAILGELAKKGASDVAARMRRAACAPSAPDRVVQMLEERVVALLDLAEAGAHGCDLMRCAATASGAQPSGGHNGSNGGAGAFGDDAREALREALRSGLRTGELCAPDEDAALATIELAFAALSPPQLYRFERAVATAQSSLLARLVVFGLVERRTTRG